MKLVWFVHELLATEFFGLFVSTKPLQCYIVGFRSLENKIALSLSNDKNDIFFFDLTAVAARTHFVFFTMV